MFFVWTSDTGWFGIFMFFGCLVLPRVFPQGDWRGYSVALILGFLNLIVQCQSLFQHPYWLSTWSPDFFKNLRVFRTPGEGGVPLSQMAVLFFSLLIPLTLIWAIAFDTSLPEPFRGWIRLAVQRFRLEGFQRIARQILAPEVFGAPWVEENRERLHDTAARVAKMPTETFSPNLGQLAVLDLKQRLDNRSMAYSHCREKSELVELLQSSIGSSEQQCAICFEDYVEGDDLRVLPSCKHLFHLTCIDRWAYSAATQQQQPGKAPRNPSCPLCNVKI